MKRILIYRHPDCDRCGRIVRIHHRLDWLDRIADTTDDPRSGALRRGEVVVENLAAGEIKEGAEAFRLICRQVPLYWILVPLLRIPAVRARVDRDLRGL